MSILDRLKFKKAATTDSKKEKKEKKEVKAVKPKEVKKPLKEEETEVQSVVGPDGRLTASTKKADKKPLKARPKKEETGDAYRVLIRPLITEKGSSLGVFNQYVFEVATQTNKIEVRKAIRKVYGINPIKVNIMNMSGKSVRYGRTEGMTRHWKKAIITLPQGQKIEIQEGL